MPEAPDPVADAALLARAAAGDQLAWNALVNRHTRRLWGVVRRYRMSEQDAADVVQLTWLLLLQHIDSIRDPSRLFGWLATAARRQCVRLLARPGRHWSVLDDDLPDVVDATDPEGHVLATEREAELRRAFQRLPERCQHLLRLTVVTPLGYDDVARQLDMPKGSVGPTRCRCLHRLRRLIEADARGG